MNWDIDGNDQLSALTNELASEDLIGNSLNATKMTVDEKNEYLLFIHDELDIDVNDNIDALTDRIILQCLLGFTGEDLTKGIVARSLTRRQVEHIVAYLRMLIGLPSREMHLFEGVSFNVTFYNDASNNIISQQFVVVDFMDDISISDGNGGTDSATVTITVPNEAPSAVNDEATVRLGTTGTIDVLANDIDSNGDNLSVTGFSETSSQGVTIARDGNSLHYTPADGFRGIDSFEYSISDGNGGTDSATVTITVPNEAPSAVNDEATVRLGTTGTIDVLANDIDSNGDNLSVTGFSETSSQGVTIARDGNSLHYTPADGFRGIDSFEYSISDGNGGTDSATVTITVPNEAPSAVNDEATVRLGTTGTIDVLANDIDSNGDNLSVTGFSLDPVLSEFINILRLATLEISSDSKSMILTNNIFPIGEVNSYVGNFEYSISDGNGGTDSATATITLGEVLSVTAFSETSSQRGISDGNGGTDSATVTITVPKEAPIAKETDGDVPLQHEVALNIGGSEDDKGFGIATDSNGNVWTTGRFSGSIDMDGDGNNDFTSNGKLDSYVIKFSANAVPMDINRENVPANTVEGKQIIGNDNLYTTTGQRETLEGDTGNDTITGNRGSDVLLGGAGADVFVYNSVADSGADPNARNEPGDSIVDFNPTEDAIQLDFEIASGTLVSIDDVQIETESINDGMATIKLSTHNSFKIILENLDPTTDPTTIESIIRNSIITPPLETI